MDGAPIDELYLRWLYEQVADPEQDPKWWKLFRILYTTEFVWIVANDEDRIADGKALRQEFIDSHHIRLTRSDRHWTELGCSMLELMVGLSFRLEFEADNGKAHAWFWVLMENIGLSQYDDSRRVPERYIRGVLEMIIQRYYEPNGQGGFFPLERPSQDQRDVEIVYQLSAYVLEKHLAG